MNSGLITWLHDSPALVNVATGSTLTYADLVTWTQKREAVYEGERRLIFLFARNSMPSVLAYLSSVQSDQPVALLDHGLSVEFRRNLVDRYEPAYIHWEGGTDDPVVDGYQEVAPSLFVRSRIEHSPLHPELAVLLTTSGSTGSQKLVRLSRANVLSNAKAIATSLELTRSDRAITTLPFHYSYGMSVINSHLVVGATVVVGELSVLQKEFWEAVRTHKVTSFAGVPFTFQMLDRTGFDTMDLPHLKYVTQAGGSMSRERTRVLAEALKSRGIRLNVMYGQTEAAPRISCLSVTGQPEKIGSVGRAIDGGELMIDAGEVGEGEVAYRGPNVMMGYASDVSDLCLGDVQGDTLRTGDLGFLDDEGFLYITGRMKRIAKLFGLRLNLDEIEAMVQGLGQCAAVNIGDTLYVHHLSTDESAVTTAQQHLEKVLKLPPQAITFQRLDVFPTLGNDKIDYRRLEKIHDEPPVG
ncbi:AMP-binding protein [Aeromicrobium sp.]|uniref:AMP-binding protein n=1 Tax=Aeromicrobium sp. TaxID=1871063 RepID=UPI003D6BF08C